MNAPSHSDVSAPLAELAMRPSAAPGVRAMHSPKKPKLLQLTRGPLSQHAGTASAVQPSSIGPLISARQHLGFAGVDQIGDALDCPSVSLQTLAPPDTNAAVGDTQVVQWVNMCYAVFDKFTGALIAGPFAGNAFWQGFGGPCETSNDGDIIIQWDKRNHRWVAAQNVFAGPPSIPASRSPRLPMRRAVTTVMPSRTAGLPRLPEVGAYAKRLLPDPKRLRPRHSSSRCERLRL